MKATIGERERLMKVNPKILAGVILSLLLLSLNLIVYTVDTTEYAVVTQFGNPVNIVLEPGLKFKLPDPIQSVQRFDNRIQVYKAQPLELLTNDKKSVTVDYYGTWRITDPLLYMKTVKDKVGAEARLLDVFSSSLGIELGQYNLDELINVDANKLKLTAMMQNTAEKSKEKAKEYGLEVIDAQIKVLNFPEANKKSVFARMKAEREQMAKQYRSEGSEEATKIKADAEKEQKILLSEAYKQAQKVKGEGDAEAIKTYAQAFQKDPKFYEFIRALETYEKTIDDKTTLVLPSNSEILKYLGNSTSGG
ncbi:protease modulator HflC [Sporomusa sphaeroides]|jgi:membrane protease subunit HflC|uniref:protease modulator HflC n=1 Tax=Sporomusa sphaeroides TaxID=47679 RepID=UPI002C90675F|nr:protease modulator HflC [Sporomusa sphaeroides]HML35189.1 protease modulator HflC [Sporomusa sphaeroides]